MAAVPSESSLAPADAARLAALREAKARGLVRRAFGVDRAEGAEFPKGSALRSGQAGWVYRADDAARSLGAALLWATRSELGELHLLVDDRADAGVLARRAGLLAGADEAPALTVWQVDSDGLVAAEPAELPPSRPEPLAARPFAEMLADAGLEVVVEAGILRGEVLGLEVARVVTVDDQTWLEVGIGRFDREAGAMLHGGRPATEALADVVGRTRAIRRPDGPPHPLNRLGRERWLRVDVVGAPARVGLTDLVAVEPPLERRNLREPAPAPALGAAVSGETVLVVCSVGVDLEVVPNTADLVLRHRPDRVVVVVPPRDRLGIHERLARRLTVPVSVVGVAGGWPA